MECLSDAANQQPYITNSSTSYHDNMYIQFAWLKLPQKLLIKLKHQTHKTSHVQHSQILDIAIEIGVVLLAIKTKVVPTYQDV